MTTIYIFNTNYIQPFSHDLIIGNKFTKLYITLCIIFSRSRFTYLTFLIYIDAINILFLNFLHYKIYKL
jgi:hypothetical protein